MVVKPLAGTDLSLPVPEAGLSEVLRAWNGKGQLLDALACVADDEAERKWSRRDIERRANRVLWERIAPDVAQWPSSVDRWLEALPAETYRETVLAGAPLAGTSWRETRRFGWPPKEFVVRQRHRVADTLLATCLRWTLERSLAVLDDATALEPSLADGVEERVAAAMATLTVPPIATAVPVEPDQADLRSLRAEGRPWTDTARVAARLLDAERSSIEDLAREWIMPASDLRWRLFHLGVLGEVLLAIRQSGGKTTSIRPLSATTAGPAYVVEDSKGRPWHLWFEAGGTWSYYKRSEPYTEATVGLSGTGVLGTDLLLIRPDEEAILIECKYSGDAATVGRRGYTQVLAYMAEARTSLAPIVTGAVVCPSGVLAKIGRAETAVGTLSILEAGHIGQFVVTALDTATVQA